VTEVGLKLVTIQIFLLMDAMVVIQE